MTLPDEEAVDRFRRRTRGTDEATLYRNLSAGVYGPAGSRRRAVAEHALQRRFTEAAEAVQLATAGDTRRADTSLRRAQRFATWALGVAVVALVVALVGLGRAFGLF